MHLKANKLKYDRSQYRVFVPNPGPITLCPRRSGNACVTGIVTVQESKEAAAARVALRGRNVGWKELEYEKAEEMVSMCIRAVGRVELQFSAAPACRYALRYPLTPCTPALLPVAKQSVQLRRDPVQGA